MRAASSSILLAFSIAFTLPATPVDAQSGTPLSPTDPAVTAPAVDSATYPLRRIGGGVTAPQLLHLVKPQFSDEARRANFFGIVPVSLIVDTNGMPRNVHVVHGIGMGLDERAVEAVKQYTFEPAMEGGKPVAVELDLKVDFAPPGGWPDPASLRPLPIQSNDTHQKRAAPLTAQEATPATSGSDAATSPTTPDPTISPLRRVGGGVTQPELLYRVDAEFSEQARLARFSGMVVVHLIVDTNGLPRNVHVLRGVGMGLDENAVAAVSQFKFKPAMEDGKPVAVELNVEVTFQIYADPPKVLHSVPLELTDEARANHASGTVFLAFTVDTHGVAQNVRVMRGAGMGMDEKAVEAIKQYKFKPYRKDHRHVAQPTMFPLNFDAK